ncbi:MAG: ABC transporter ATP-binding protein [Candidatus Caldarchaeum sp.]|nr:ABC transporter ATP-binding protein [Candidatus Caldarchaeum sp.]
MKEIVKVSSLVKVYGDRVKVGPIDLTIREKEVYGLVGPNGSGKTTTLRAVLGLLKPSSGKVEVFGFDPFTNPEKVNERVGYSPEIPAFPPFYSAEKLLKTTCAMKKIYGMDADQHVKEILDLTGLVNHAHRKVGNFSKGMIQRLSIGQALVGDPPLLVLDEPMLGVDPVGRAHIRDVLFELKKRGKTILFSSHELYEVERLSDRVGMIYLGRTVFEEEVGKLRNARKMVSISLARPPHNALVESLLNVEGVKQILENGTKLIISIEDYIDPREKLAEIIVSSGFGLTEMKLVEQSLEDIFIAKVKEAVGG